VAIYFDYAATSPMRPAVIEAYAAALSVVGNPASIHSQGQQAKRMLEESREHIAASLGADPIEVTFTSGGTESVNLAVKGLYWGAGAGRTRILTTRAEHHATIDAVEWLAAAQGAAVDWIPVDALGRIDLAALERALGDDVALVSTLWANNEVGTIQPIAEIVALAARHGVPVHADAVAAYGSLPIDFHASGLAALSVSAHKIGGPVGIGALLVARSESVVPLIHGGNQQRFRSGTQDAAGAVAFAAATTAAVASLATPVPPDLEPEPQLELRPEPQLEFRPEPQLELEPGPVPERVPVPEPARPRRLRDRLVAGIRTAVPDAVYRGDPSAEGRLPGNAHFTFPGCEGDSLLFLLDVAGFSVSTGSACQAGVPEASHVLLAMGLTESEARGALRFTLGQCTTEAEVDALVAALPAAVARARAAGLADREVARGR
jgi:cysteine desulfurase